MKPHKYAKIIKAWADGAEIEYLRMGNEGWAPIFKGWSWDCDFAVQYRIKPETKPDIEKFFLLESNPILGLRLNEISGFQKRTHEDWIRIVFDGETAKMKSVEILK
jgi:hypothetical protein